MSDWMRVCLCDLGPKGIHPEGDGVSGLAQQFLTCCQQRQDVEPQDWRIQCQALGHAVVLWSRGMTHQLAVLNALVTVSLQGGDSLSAQGMVHVNCGQ